MKTKNEIKWDITLLERRYGVSDKDDAQQWETKMEGEDQFGNFYDGYAIVEESADPTGWILIELKECTPFVEPTDLIPVYSISGISRRMRQKANNTNNGDLLKYAIQLSQLCGRGDNEQHLNQQYDM